MNNIQKKLDELSIDPFRFQPSHAWYKQIGIGKKRFGRIVRNEEQPTLQELQSIAHALDIPMQQLIDPSIWTETPE